MPKLLPLHSILSLLISLCYSISYAADDDNKYSSLQAESTVYIDTAILARTGIKTLKLVNTQLNPEIETFAVRVNLASLINTRKEYLNALAQQETASIKLQQSQRNFQRIKNLQRDQAISTRKLRDQQTQLKIDQTLFNTAQLQVSTIQLYTQEKWGKVLSHRFLSDGEPSVDMMNILTRPLYLIYHPDQTAPSSKTIFLQAFGRRDKAQSASLIDHAAILDNHPQQTGTPYFYLSDQAAEGYHQRLVAWLPLKGNKVSGVVIPASALVWHLGQAFVYLQVDNDQFKRTEITQKKLIYTNSYFIQHELQPDDIVVSVGAQLLLSEEFRAQIPAENDDDDD